MRYQKSILLKNNAPCLLRNAVAADAQDVLQHLIVTSGETDNMVRYADEITLTVAEEQAYLADLENNPKAIMLIAMRNGALVATAGFSPVSSHSRCRHRATFGISVKKPYWGMGIGSAMLSAIIACAKTAGYEQLELEVVAGNEQALRLYRKFGFRTYGTRERSFRYRDGNYAAEHLMYLELFAGVSGN